MVDLNLFCLAAINGLCCSFPLQVVGDGVGSFGIGKDKAFTVSRGRSIAVYLCYREPGRGRKSNPIRSRKPVVTAVRGKRYVCGTGLYIEMSSCYACEEFQVISICTLCCQCKRAFVDNVITDTKRTAERHSLVFYLPVCLILDRLPFIENLSLFRGDGQRGFAYSKR